MAAGVRRQTTSIGFNQQAWPGTQSVGGVFWKFWAGGPRAPRGAPARPTSARPRPIGGHVRKRRAAQASGRPRGCRALRPRRPQRGAARRPAPGKQKKVPALRACLFVPRGEGRGGVCGSPLRGVVVHLRHRRDARLPLLLRRRLVTRGGRLLRRGVLRRLPSAAAPPGAPLPLSLRRGRKRATWGRPTRRRVLARRPIELLGAALARRGRRGGAAAGARLGHLAAPQHPAHATTAPRTPRGWQQPTRA